MNPTAAARNLKPRNATEDAILAAARELLNEEPFERLTVDGIARRAFVSRTAVYFYFDGKRAVIDRLIQQAFTEMYDAAAIYLEGSGDPRSELRLALGRMVAAVNRNGTVLLLAAHLSGREDRLPPEWEPYIRRFVIGTERRIRRDQERGIAPDDISARISAQALCAMVERHISLEVVRGGGDVTETIRVLSELWWRAAYYAQPGPGAADGGDEAADAPRATSPDDDARPDATAAGEIDAPAGATP